MKMARNLKDALWMVEELCLAICLNSKHVYLYIYILKILSGNMKNKSA